MTETRVYIAEVSGEGADALPADRLKKAARFRFEKDRMRSLTAGRLLHQACADAGIPGADEHVLTGKQGKPYFAYHPEWRFSLSHSGELAMCVMSGREVGCDIEKISDKETDKLAKRFFSAAENELLEKTAEEERAGMFYRLWTLKESFLKCTGDGLTRPLDSFTVRIGESGPEIEDAGDGYTYRLYERTGIDGYCAAWCERAENT
ncbi:MAG: 4'-phosphopantetheinyl transferase superfamily protein [Clostridia bacterium]|nr:4'-phosphopantetheinyl transferase superfamily protein [Clostridia bacterium]